MSRKVLTGAGCGHFITFSTYGRRSLLASPRARQVVISRLGLLATQGRVKVSGFVIMPDHVHAVFWFEDDTVLPEVIKVWKSGSSHWLIKLFQETSPEILDRLKVKRSGRTQLSIWQRRYYDFNLRNPDKLREKLTYMHYNPVKKGLCASPTDWLWSSARWYDLRKSVGVKIEPGL